MEKRAAEKEKFSVARFQAQRAPQYFVRIQTGSAIIIHFILWLFYNSKISCKKGVSDAKRTWRKESPREQKNRIE